MKGLVSKFVTPVLAATTLFCAPLFAENKSNIHFGVGGLSSANEDVSERYDGLFGGKLGVDIRLSKYLRSSIDISVYTKSAEVKGVECSATLVQFEPTIQAAFENNGVIIYGGLGVTYIQANEKASKGKDEAEASNDAGGIVAKVGLEFPSKKSNWGGFVEFSFRNAVKDEVAFGGTSLDIGAKYYFDK